MYFRDVRFLVQAGLLMLFYATPLIYSVTDLGPAGRWLSLNPLTGVMMLFQASVGQVGPVRPAVVCTLSIALAVAAAGLARPPPPRPPVRRPAVADRPSTPTQKRGLTR